MSNHTRARISTIMLLAVAVSAAGNIAHAQCTDYEQRASWIGGIDPGWRSDDVALVGDLAYIVRDYNPSGLEIMDISGSSGPVPVGGVALPGLYGEAVAVAGQFAYVANWDGGLQIVDVSNPAAPVIAGSLATTDRAYGIAAANGLVYVAANSELLIVDAAVPAAPVVLGSLVPGGAVRDIVVQGNLAYLTGPYTGLLVVDVTDPAAPVAVSTAALSGSGFYFGVAVTAGRAFVADTRGPLLVVDVNDPAVPVPLGDVPGVGYTAEVTAVGDRVYVPDFGLVVLDASVPGVPPVIGRVFGGKGPAAVAVDGDRACMACYYEGVHAIDLGHPDPVPLLGEWDTGGTSRGVTVAAGKLFLQDYVGDLQIADISDPLHPLALGSVAVPGFVSRIAVAGERAFIADSDGLRIVDFAAPAAPVLVGSYLTSGDCRGVALAGETAVLASGVGGIVLVDASDPYAPAPVSSLSLPGQALDVAVQGDIAWAAARDAGLQVLDISDPAAPAVVASVPFWGYTVSVAVAGDLVYVCAGNELHIVDGSNPVLPVIVGSVPIVANGVFLHVAGDLALVGEQEAGLHVYDVSDPANPRRLGNAMAGGDYAVAYATGPGVIYAGHPYRSLEILALPSQDCDGNGVDDCADIAADPGRDWNRDGILDACQQGPAPAAVRDLPAVALAGVDVVPNPFNPRTTVMFELGRAEVIDVAVYDTAGRLVRTLLRSAAFPAGQGRTAWDGRDDAGQMAASGVYFFRVSAGQDVVSRRAVLLK